MAKKFTLQELGEMLTFLVKRMATREDVEEIVEKKVQPVIKTQNEHTKILADHTRDLNIIKHDVKTNLDKRLQLEVRMTNVERRVSNL